MIGVADVGGVNGLRSTRNKANKLSRLTNNVRGRLTNELWYYVFNEPEVRENTAVAAYRKMSCRRRVCFSVIFASIKADTTSSSSKVPPSYSESSDCSCSRSRSGCASSCSRSCCCRCSWIKRRDVEVCICLVKDNEDRVVRRHCAANRIISKGELYFSQPLPAFLIDGNLHERWS
jgi:hypothetical protein